MREPTSISIRSYQVGFGDCFLVSLRYDVDIEKHILIDFGSTSLPKDAPKSRMKDIAADIANRSGGKLTAVIATHRHKDHISGFDAKNGRGPGATIQKLKPDLVIQPWTEDPRLAPDATGPVQKGPGSLKGARKEVASLAAMQLVAGQMLEEVKRGRYLRGKLREEISFLGDDNISNRGAVENLMAMARNEYVHCETRSRLEDFLPGVEVHVLGPPTVDQTQTIKKQKSNDPDQFWHLQAAAGTFLPRLKGGKVRPLFPDHVRGKSAGGFPIDARWLIHHSKRLRGQQMLRIVRMLDKSMNNTSLILLFRIGGKSLLFPGDAQIENWAYALSKPKYEKMLRDVDVYKVGHHGSLNATPKTLWNLFGKRSSSPAEKERLTSLMSTMAGKHGSVDKRTEVPRKSLSKALDDETNLFSTEQLQGSEFFHDTVIKINDPHEPADV